MTEAEVASAQRRQAAAEYRPELIDLLVVAEAPPCDLDRYFYFEDVPKHDWLFRHVSNVILGYKPDRNGKREALIELREPGFFLIDLKEDPTTDDDPSAVVDDLVSRCVALRPARIVFDAVYGPLVRAGLPVMDAGLPFPASGQQRRFEEGFAKALDAGPA